MHKRAGEIHTVCLPGSLIAARKFQSWPSTIIIGRKGRETSSPCEASPRSSAISLASLISSSSLVSCAAVYMPTCVVASSQFWPVCFVSMLTPIGRQRNGSWRVWFADIGSALRWARSRRAFRKRSDGSMWMAKSIIFEFSTVPAWPGGIREGGEIRAEVLITLVSTKSIGDQRVDKPVQEVQLFFKFIVVQRQVKDEVVYTAVPSRLTISPFFAALGKPDCFCTLFWSWWWTRELCWLGICEIIDCAEGVIR